MNFEYKTRGMSAPQGKANIYFSAHPDDFDIYFDALSDEILRHSNCAIWYSKTEQDLNSEEIQFDLDQMQLFVFPITLRFLSGDNVALQVYRYALSKHIPILPIAVEQGLESQFSVVCGDVQFVDRTNQDITVIGYDEKLERFLTSVLLSNDTMQKIRDAFDAYIFLSYRKKDRKQAQNLMRLIHMNETCRRLAIWYDEFLVPGENFNDAIADAMRSSAAFALTVTPSLLEDGNYVQQIEYPYAKSLGKHILPFEVQKTDHEMLASRYEGLAKCVNADEASVTQYMVEAYKVLAIQPKERDSIHNFFIGLAYLSGMDVEKDSCKAVELISGAAEEGLPEAMEKMVSMYRAAEGVERDYDKALKWQIRYVERMKEVIKSTPSSDSFLQLFRAEADLISFFMEQNRYEEAKLQCSEMEDYVNSTGDSSFLMYSMYMRPRIEQGIEMQGNAADDPQPLFLQCCEFCKKEYERNKSQLALQMLTQCYLELGRIAYDSLQMTVAREFYEKSIGYCRYLIAEVPQPRYRGLLSIVLSEHATIECFLKRYNRANEDLNEAISLARALYDEYRTPDQCRCVAALHMQLGELSVKTDKLADAQNHYTHAEELFNEYQRQTMSIDAETALLDLYDNIAELYAKENQVDRAWEYYCRESELAKHIRENVWKADTSFAEWRICMGKGELLDKKNQADDAMNMYIAAYKSAEGISDQSKTLQRYGQYIRYASVVTIYSHAKKHNMREYVQQYQAKLLTMIPHISVPKISNLKELWSRSAVFDGASFNPMSTYAELMGDTFNWSFDDDKFMGIKLQPILKWLKNNLFIWRIPFYPLLSMVWLLLCHMIYGYTNFERLSICYADCMIGQTAYQSISALIMAIVYAAVRGKKQSKAKSWINVGASLLISILVGCVVVNAVGSENFIPDSMHIVYLILPLYSAIVGCIFTKLASVFLNLVVKEKEL